MLLSAKQICKVSPRFIKHEPKDYQARRNNYVDGKRGSQVTALLLYLFGASEKRSVTLKRQDGNGAVRAGRIVGCCKPASLAARLASVKTLTAASALGAVLVLAGCAGANSAVEPSASPPSSSATSPSPAAVAATTSGSALTGFGAIGGLSGDPSINQPVCGKAAITANGDAGVGKTLSARHYAGWDTVEPYLRAFSLMESVPAPGQALASRSIVYTPTVANTPRTVDKGVTFYHTRLSWGIGLTLYPGEDLDARAGFGEANGPFAELLIVDEADRLKTPALEQLRDHHDRTGIGLILIGMPGIEKRLARCRSRR